MNQPVLSAALEAALLRQLAVAWNDINYSHFRGKLQPPSFDLHAGDGRLGLWDSEARRISLARSVVLQQPWVVVCEILKHETAHQFVDEVMGVRDETAHGPTFEGLCRKLGFDASASGFPPGSAAAPGHEPAVLRRIGKLLALAESPNRHEAELAMQQAQRLMLKHNVDSAAASAAQGYGYRQLGQPRRRIDAHEQILAGILTSHFFVEAIWVPSYLPLEGRAGRVLEICGTPGNLDVAAYVHGFLLATGDRLWTEHKRSHRIAGDRDRRRFLLGLMIGFKEKLSAGVAESRREGLVWRGDASLTAYYGLRHPRRASGGSVRYRHTAAHEHGRNAGRNIVLHRPMGSGGTGAGNRRLLLT